MASRLYKMAQALFGLTDLTNGNVGQFGSLAAGSKAYVSAPIGVNDGGPAEVQTAQFGEGWTDAVIGSGYPSLEDRNSLDYLFSYQLAYLMQQGIPEWDSTTIYFSGSMCLSGGVIFVCFNDNSGAGISGQNPTAPGSIYWAVYQAPGNNLILNGAFDYWQRGNSNVAYNATSTFVYGPDRWAGRNMIGSSYNVLLSQQTASLTGSGSAFQAQIQAVGSGGSGGVEVFHLLDNIETISLSGKLASFAAHISPLGNVNQVSIQFYGSTSATSAAQNLVALGSPTVFNIATYGQVCSVLGQLIPSSGYKYIGIRVWVSGVSSGNLYDINNGFQIEQAILNQGASVAQFSRAFPQESSEIAAIFRYYEKSDLSTADPGVVWNGGSGQAVSAWAPFKILKRGTPGANGSAASTISSVSGTGSWGTTSVIQSYPAGLAVQVSSSPATSGDYGVSYFTADAEIY